MFPNEQGCCSKICKRLMPYSKLRLLKPNVTFRRCYAINITKFSLIYIYIKTVPADIDIVLILLTLKL